MHHEEKCISISCDNCKEVFRSSYTDFSLFADECQADEDAEADEWYVNEGAHYCPKCWDFDKDDNLIIKHLPN